TSHDEHAAHHGGHDHAEGPAPSLTTVAGPEEAAHAIDAPGGEHAAHGGHAAHGSHDKHAGHGGHDKHAGHDPEVFRRRFWLTLVLTVPVVLFSETVQDWFAYSLEGVPGNELVPPVLGSVVFVYGGHVFLAGGWREV